MDYIPHSAIAPRPSNPNNPTGDILRVDRIAHWLRTVYIPQFEGTDMAVIACGTAATVRELINRVDPEFDIGDGFKKISTAPYPLPDFLAETIHHIYPDFTWRGATGGRLFTFGNAAGAQFQVLVIGAIINTDDRVTVLACLPIDYAMHWLRFELELDRLAHTLNPEEEVTIIGGRSQAFKPDIRWDDLVLPLALKTAIQDDVRSFFERGIDIYARFKLKPFRKILLAGVPGTGKTMICSAIAQWAIDRKYLVIYVSSGDNAGPTFAKVEDAVAIAARSQRPTIILVEDFDVYTHPHEKAQVLNVLDGAESLINSYGTLLVATTNHPQLIDERILKRPGRLDRIYIVPEIGDLALAEQMLRHYLGEFWRDEHGSQEVLRQLVNQPGAFVREVAIAALIQAADMELEEVSLDLLLASLRDLKAQMVAKEDFLEENKVPPMGFEARPYLHRLQKAPSIERFDFPRR